MARVDLTTTGSIRGKLRAKSSNLYMEAQDSLLTHAGL